MTLFNRFLFALALAAPWWGAAASALAQPPPPPLEAEQIIERALNRNRENEKAGLESQFTFQILTLSEKLAKDGSIEESRTKLYRSVPVEGASFERLLAEDGVPLSADRSREEDRRQREFLEKLRRGEKPDQGSRERVVFDENLTAKYNFAALGVETVRGRPSYVLGYKPKSGDLPVRTRMDRALNKAEGKIWFDAETFEVARVQFELKEKVNLWWGLIGSISALRGHVERAPVPSGVWFPNSVKIYLNGRIFFASLHRRETLQFRDFERVEESAAVGRPAAGGSR